MPTDSNTMDDWWNEGFDAFFAGSRDQHRDAEKIEDDRAWWKWRQGWLAARAYRRSIIGASDA